MAKGKYAKWIEKDNLLLIKGWARQGLTDEEIAKCMGISRSTLNLWREKYSDISDAIKKGREPTNVVLEDTAFERATQWKTVKDITREIRFNRDTGKNELTVVKEVERKVPPDSTILIFLLKNRMKDIYGDSKSIELSGQIETNNPFEGLTEEQLRKLAKGGGSGSG